MRGGNTERAQAQPSRPHEPRPPPGLGVRGYSLAFPAATLVGFTWRGVTPRSAESRWRMSCDGNFSRANTCSSTTRTGREMFQRGALMSRFAGSVGAAKRGEGGSAGGAAGRIEYPRPEYPRPKGQTPLPHATPGGSRARAPPPPAPPLFGAPLPPQPGGAMNWPTALTSIGLWLSGARAHGGQRAGLGLMRGPKPPSPGRSARRPRFRLSECLSVMGGKAADLPRLRPPKYEK